VQSPNEAEPHIFTCPGNRGTTTCEHFLAGYLPREITIKVTSKGTLTSLSVEPNYREIAIGGACSKCRGGTVEVVL
jgi:hypothetical protein